MNLKQTLDQHTPLNKKKKIKFAMHKFLVYLKQSNVFQLNTKPYPASKLHLQTLNRATGVPHPVPTNTCAEPSKYLNPQTSVQILRWFW